MQTVQIHEGQRLKKWIDSKKKPLIDIVNEMGFSNYSHVYYYYPQARIKIQMLDKFCKVLGITRDEFYVGVAGETNIENESDAYSISTHQGRNLENIISNSGITVTAFASKVGSTRKTIYEYFKENTLDEGFLMHAASVLKVPIAQIKGIGVGEKSFEKDIYIQLQKINEKLDKLISAN